MSERQGLVLDARDHEIIETIIDQLMEFMHRTEGANQVCIQHVEGGQKYIVRLSVVPLMLEGIG